MHMPSVGPLDKVSLSADKESNKNNRLFVSDMDLRSVSQGPALRAIFFAHLVPVVWVTQYHWLPYSYSIYNTLFFVSLFWSMHARDSEDAIFMSSALNVVAILLDAITIGMYYGFVGSNSFNTFMCIVNLLLRPITSLVLLRFYNERAGSFSGIGFAGIPGFASTGFSDRGSYEDLERTRIAPHQSVPSHPTEVPTDILTK